MTRNSKKIGLIICISLVVGNMIGSGIFVLPAALAPFGGISILGWVISGLGALAVATVFARLSKLLPKTGGPYIYSAEALGSFTGFMVGWGYWISILCTNAAIAAAFAGYLSVFLPFLNGNPVGQGITAVMTIWFLTWLNGMGVKNGGVVATITTIIKIIPLLALSIAGLFYFNVQHFQPFNSSQDSFLTSLSTTITITLFAYLGIESATVPAKNVRNPTRTIPRATWIGTGIAILIYLVSSLSIMGMISPETLATSTAPFADAAEIVWGQPGRYIIAFGAIVSTFGALNGWLLIQGQIPYAMAIDKLLPPVFSRLSKREYPLTGMFISSLIVTILVISNYTKGLVQMFTFLILLSTFTSLLSYIFSSFAEAMILVKSKPSGWAKRTKQAFLIGIPAFLFSVLAVYGAGADIVLDGFLAILAGLPFYVWARIKKNMSI